jgi:hypothetical protein
MAVADLSQLVEREGLGERINQLPVPDGCHCGFSHLLTQSLNLVNQVCAQRGFRQGTSARHFCSASRASKEPASDISSNATLPFVAVPASTEPDDFHPTHFGLKCPYENQGRGFSSPANTGRAGSNVRCAADICRLRRRDDKRRYFYAVAATARD